MIKLPLPHTNFIWLIEIDFKIQSLFNFLKTREIYILRLNKVIMFPSQNFWVKKVTKVTRKLLSNTFFTGF